MVAVFWRKWDRSQAAAGRANKEQRVRSASRRAACQNSGAKYPIQYRSST